MTDDDNQQMQQAQQDEERRRSEQCTHFDRPSVLSLPSIGGAHTCAECWAALDWKPPAGGRDSWDRAGSDHHMTGGVLYTRGAGGYFVPDEQPKGMERK